MQKPLYLYHIYHILKVIAVHTNNRLQTVLIINTFTHYNY